MRGRAAPPHPGIYRVPPPGVRGPITEHALTYASGKILCRRNYTAFFSVFTLGRLHFPENLRIREKESSGIQGSSLQFHGWLLLLPAPQGHSLFVQSRKCTRNTKIYLCFDRVMDNFYAVIEVGRIWSWYDPWSPVLTSISHMWFSPLQSKGFYAPACHIKDPRYLRS